MRVVAAGFLGLAAAGTPAGAQVALRYSPEIGATARVLIIERTVTTLFGFPAAPDGFSFETERRMNATQRVQQQREPGWIVEVTVDSVRGRRRPLDGGWSDLADASAGEGYARLQIDQRFRASVLDSRGTFSALATRIPGAGLAGPGIGFPGGSLTIGTPFPSGGTIQFAVALGDEAGIPLRRTVAGPLNLVIDSVAGTDRDELIYLSFRGTFEPTAEEAAGENQSMGMALQGAFAGRLIWSRAWNAFVSGAARLRVDGRMRVTDAAGDREAAASWDVRVTTRVRP